MISLARISRLERLLDDLAPPEPEHLSLLCWCALGGRPEAIPELAEEDQALAARMLTSSQEPDPVEEAIARAACPRPRPEADHAEEPSAPPSRASRPRPPPSPYGLKELPPPARGPDRLPDG